MNVMNGSQKRDVVGVASTFFGDPVVNALHPPTEDEFMRTQRLTRIVKTALIMAVVSHASACKFRTAATRRANRTVALSAILERFRAESHFPGAVGAAWIASDSSVIAAAVGLADRDLRTPMTDRSLLHAGSIGKTLFAALALQLVGERRIALDDRVSRYLGDQQWYRQLPNNETITVRMLLNHTSGLPEYGYDFMVDLIHNPGRVRSPLEGVKSVAGAAPKSRAGAVFSYSDVNFQLLQLLIERVTGSPAYAEIQRRFLVPFHLSGIVPADRKSIPGMAQGYAGSDSFMGFDAVMKDGGLILDPAFEGGGGGFVTNTGDLARWIALFADGKVFPQSLLPEVRRGVPAGQLDVGPNAKSGLGIEIVETPLGMAYGHGGFFPGYLSAAMWYPERGIGVAIQVNSSARNALGRPLRDVLLEVARALSDSARFQ